MVFSVYKKQRILRFASLGLKPPSITKELQKEKLKCLRVGIYKFFGALSSKHDDRGEQNVAVAEDK